MSNIDDLYRKLSDAKIKVLSYKDSHFLFGLLCRLPHKLDPSHDAIASTNGESVTFNPERLFKYSVAQQAFVMCHEVLHVALLHITRKGTRDHELFNIAADYYINNHLKAQGFELIPNIYVDPKYNGMYTEEIYDLLKEEKDKTGQMPQTDTGKPNALGDDIDYQDGSSPDSNSSGKSKQEVEQSIQKAVAATAMEAQLSDQAGSIPGEIKRYLDKMLQPKVQWRPLLLRYLTEINKLDYSWRKPNRRYLPNDIYLPSLHSETLACLDFAIDVSGSISPKEFNQFVAEVDHVFRSCNPKELNVLQFDHVLCGFDKVRQVADIENIEFKGGGGTSPQAALDKTAETGAKAIIILTDGYFNTDVLQNPGKPVIWIVYNNDKFVPPFGEAITYELDD